MANDRIVVVGSSSGGVRALQVLAAQLGPDFPAPILVVQHVGGYRSILPMLLTRNGSLPASHPEDGDLIRAGHILVAPPDRHMVLDEGRVRLLRTPKENHTRPAIDPLFRSAAISRGAAAIGVLLTGALDDGTAGLQAIARAGGTTVVQDPADAQAPSMPSSAIRYVAVNYVVTLASMGVLLRRLAGEPARAAQPSEARQVQRAR